MSRHGFKEADLDTEVTRVTRCDIAVELGADWEMVGCYLGFSSDELRDINREICSQEMCRVALLDTWSKREGKGATYLKLAQALHRRKRQDLVELLCTKLSHNVSSGDMPPSGKVSCNPTGIFTACQNCWLCIHCHEKIPLGIVAMWEDFMFAIG